MSRFHALLSILVALLIGAPLSAGLSTQKIFDAYNVSSTSYVYDSSGSTDAETGWLDAAGFRNKSIVVNIATLNATSIDIRIEGRHFVGGYASNGAVSVEIFSKSYTAVTAVGDSISVPEVCDQIRVGVKLTGDAGAQSVTITFADGV